MSFGQTSSQDFVPPPPNIRTIMEYIWGFPHPVVETSPSNAGGAGSVPGWGTKISHASWPKNQNKTEHYCNKFSKDFKNV